MNSSIGGPVARAAHSKAAFFRIVAQPRFRQAPGCAFGAPGETLMRRPRPEPREDPSRRRPGPRAGASPAPGRGPASDEGAARRLRARSPPPIPYGPCGRGGRPGRRRGGRPQGRRMRVFIGGPGPRDATPDLRSPTTPLSRDPAQGSVVRCRAKGDPHALPLGTTPWAAPSRRRDPAIPPAEPAGPPPSGPGTPRAGARRDAVARTPATPPRRRSEDRPPRAGRPPASGPDAPPTRGRPRPARRRGRVATSGPAGTGRAPSSARTAPAMLGP